MTLPAELTSLPRWILWRFETRDDKRTKVPYSVNGQRASTTNPATWSSFADAIAARDRVPADGIGFVFCADDNIIGVDLDHVRDVTSGAVKPWALDTIAQLDSYTELSPSGTGFHVIMRGTKPSGSQCNLRFDAVTREGFEIYDTARYFTISGNHVAGTPPDVRTVSGAALSRVLHDMEARLPKKAGAMVVPRETVAVTLNDRELLRRMFNSRQGAEIARLYHGHADYASASDADIALCGRLAFWTGKDAAQMDRLFRSSGLMRDKWDTRRGDCTYGALTIAKAIANCRETYSAAVANLTGSGGEQRSAGNRPAHEWTVAQRPAFEFRGPSGNPAIADLAIVTRDGALSVVVATERADNPGVSITNGAEQLAAQILMRLFPERVGQEQPFRLVVHHRAASFATGDRIAASMQEVRFADFRAREDCAAPRIGDVVEWRNLDARVAKLLADQTTVERIEVEQTRRRDAERHAIEAPKKSRRLRR